MHRDVKIGIAIGVLLIALVAIYWWARESPQVPVSAPERIESEAILPPPVEPVAPAGAEEEPALPEVPEVAVPEEAPPLAPRAERPVAEEASALARPAEPAQPSGRTHVVARGDTLMRIARKYYGDESNWKVILEANRDKISDPNSIPVGVELFVPDLAAARLQATSITLPAPEGPARTHTVEAGETLSSIAARYYGSEGKWRLIYEANRQKIGPDPDRLPRGAVLVIPPER